MKTPMKTQTTLRRMIQNTLGFELLSLSESTRLCLIVASSAAVALAGQVAQSRVAPTEPAINTEITKPVITQSTADRATKEVLQVSTDLSRLESYVSGQVREISEFADALTERAEVASDVGFTDPMASSKMKAALKELDERIMLARQSVVKSKKAPVTEEAFTAEDLRSNLFALQESASRAQLAIVELEGPQADPVQSFKVSRIGQ